jgi:deoxyribose-phosphate aldolase
MKASPSPSPTVPPPSPPVDAVGIADRLARVATRSIKNASKRQALDLVLSMMDLTTLEGADTPGKVRRLCHKAIHLHDALPGLPKVAAVCVYPTLVREAVKALGDSGIGVAAVASYFPSGQASMKIRLQEIREAVRDGATEIDMVISRGKFLAGDEAFIVEEVAACKEACGEAHLKVILETGELGTLDAVRRASDLALAARPDFIKTSTGKVQPAATLEVTLVMLQAIRDHYHRTGQRVGMKPAGGISTAKLALQYLVLVKETLGDAWLTPDLFRFGASTLANDVLMQRLRLEEGVYPGPHEFAMS